MPKPYCKFYLLSNIPKKENPNAQIIDTIPSIVHPLTNESIAINIDDTTNSDIVIIKIIFLILTFSLKKRSVKRQPAIIINNVITQAKILKKYISFFSSFP